MVSEIAGQWSVIIWFKRFFVYLPSRFRRQWEAKDSSCSGSCSSCLSFAIQVSGPGECGSGLSRHPWPHASSFLGLRETELMSLASAWLWFSCLPMLHIQGCVTRPSYVTALPSGECLPELQLFWVTALFSRGMGQGGTLSRLSFAPLTISCWGHHL